MTLILVNPARCRTWEMHGRSGEALSTRSCSDLLKSVRTHGQKQPVLARRIAANDGYEMELIYGVRRHFVAQQLGIDLLVECRDIDDRSALIEMDIENRLRQDISSYERGIAYKRWLNAGYFASQIMLARALRVSTAQICRLLKYAELPAVVVAAFPSPADIREEWAGVLAKHCMDATTRQQILARARASKNLAHPRSAHVIYDTLVSGGSRPKEKSACDQVIKNSRGAPLFKVAFRSRTVHLVIARDRLDKKLLDLITERLTDVLQEGSYAPPAMHAGSRRRSEEPAHVGLSGGAAAVP
jgi:ParB family chromosome partitioning protein